MTERRYPLGRGQFSAALRGSLLVAMLAICAAVSPAQQGAITSPSTVGLSPADAARAGNLGKAVKCMCGGCDMAAGMCTHSGGNFAGPCDTAKAELKEVSEAVANGQSDDQVQQSFVKEYGPTVLIEPPKSGFNLLAWVMPVVLPIFAVLLVWGVAQRWRERATPATAGAASIDTPIDPALLARAERESRDEA
jgi:cytochrome c-type biogenesis protein CcmH